MTVFFVAQISNMYLFNGYLLMFNDFYYPVAMRTIVRYTDEKEGTSVRNKLLKSMEYNEPLDMMYMDKSGAVSKRRMQVIQVGEGSFRAYCFLRKSKRTFTIDSVLALVPVVHRERAVI